jgi:WhiB family redox-sensing transcriptional regulator
MDTRDWRHQAACREADPETFFPGPTGQLGAMQAEYAKDYCRICPVADRCLQWSLEERLDEGVFGGLSEAERRRIHRRNTPGSTPEPNRGKKKETA